MGWVKINLNDQGYGVFAMLKYIAAALCLTLALSGAPAFAQPQSAQSKGVIATLMEVEGKVWVTAAGTKERKPAKLETQLHLNDVIETGPKSRTFILFIDNTQITLSENTRFTADEYAFDAEAPQQNKAHYSVARGAFQYLSGAISKTRNPNVEVETAYGTIGIRGTKFWAGEIEQEYGVNVEEGQVRVRNDGGEVFVDKGKGTSVKSRRQKPSTAMPWPAKKLQLIAATVLLSNQDAVFKRVLGFQGKNDILRGEFKNFMKLRGVPGIPGNVIPGNNIPGGIIPGEKGGMKGGFPLLDTPGGKGAATTPGGRTGPAPGKAGTTPGGRKVYKDDAAKPPLKMFKGLGL